MKKSELFFLAILVPLDYVLVVGAFIGAYFLREYLDEVFLLPFSKHLQMALILAPVWLACFAFARLYSPEVKRKTLVEMAGIVIGSCAAVTFTSAAIFLFIRELSFSRLILFLTLTLSIIFVWLGRFIVGIVQDFLYKKGVGVRKILVLGNAERAATVLRGIFAQKNPGLKIAGVLADDAKKGSSVVGIEVLGEINAFEKIIKENSPDEIIQADPTIASIQTQKIINLCEAKGIHFKYVPDLYTAPTAKIASYDLAGLPVIELSVTALEGWAVIIKRVVDILVSLLALIITAPILALTALVIRWESPGPILFFHERVGKNGKRFHLFKFRSMKMYKIEGSWVHAEEYLKVNKKLAKRLQESPFYKLADDPRMSKVGRFIRRSSIDELPQFWNVLKGEMSVVGPRAYIEKELAHQQAIHPHAQELVRRLLMVKPGITGLWQVSGRSNIEFSERVAMDAYYATHASFWMDLQIVLKTFPVVLRGSGAM